MNVFRCGKLSSRVHIDRYHEIYLISDNLFLRPEIESLACDNAMAPRDLSFNLKFHYSSARLLVSKQVSALNIRRTQALLIKYWEPKRLRDVQ